MNGNNHCWETVDSYGAGDGNYAMMCLNRI